MSWLRISLTEDERRVVMGERETYPDPLVRRKVCRKDVSVKQKTHSAPCVRLLRLRRC